VYQRGGVSPRSVADYRRAGGPRAGPLPDFFIGARAEVAGLGRLTGDLARIRSYFCGRHAGSPRERLI